MMTQPISVILSLRNSTYIAKCPELDLSGEGNSANDAIYDLEQRVEDFLGLHFPDEINIGFLGWKN